MQSEIPDKLYFKIGEVSELLGVPAYVLRFWETEFKRIKPKRTESGQRLYRRSDVELLQKIQYLLYKKRFTIPGAKRYLIDKQPLPPGISRRELLEELQAIRDLLNEASDEAWQTMLRHRKHVLKLSVLLLTRSNISKDDVLKFCEEEGVELAQPEGRIDAYEEMLRKHDLEDSVSLVRRAGQ